MAQIFAGTSGFAYDAWKPAFYPEKLPSKRFLEHYSTRLNAVEINYTFRRAPSASTLQGWVQQTHDGFLFAPKANQRITHIARLKNAQDSVDFFFRAIDPLRTSRRIGPVLFQLPPNLKADVALLSDFLPLLPADMRHAIEYRHESWLSDPIYEVLRKHNIALCLAESEKLEIPQIVTADFVYCRLRMPEYTVEQRESIAARASEWMAGGRDVFLFFKHEESPEGALYAEEILQRSAGSGTINALTG
jgi:uncharacterized protein YecE (DUF72 family)